MTIAVLPVAASRSAWTHHPLAGIINTAVKDMFLKGRSTRCPTCNAILIANRAAGKRCPLTLVPLHTALSEFVGKHTHGALLLPCSF